MSYQMKTHIRELMELLDENQGEIPNGFYLSCANKLRDLFNESDSDYGSDTSSDYESDTSSDMDSVDEEDDDTDSEDEEEEIIERRPVGRPKGSFELCLGVGDIRIRGEYRTVFRSGRGNYKYQTPKGTWIYINDTERIVNRNEFFYP
eukprot:gb/GECG01004631.1/.p1 GENE.gb/GECG01004631.1/~~gb/GECG01004631.1/.p1  ORF type:complete len:148 (+),score=26.99 gb/GECG01004631.1/:1-444(+)